MSRRVLETVIPPKLFPLVLYKRILRLHYGLPSMARMMGDSYVKDEFRRHKNANPEHLEPFFREWMEYCKVLSTQLSGQGIAKKNIGKNLDHQQLNSLAEEQIRQLYDLKVEADAFHGRSSDDMPPR